MYLLRVNVIKTQKWNNITSRNDHTMRNHAVAYFLIISIVAFIDIYNPDDFKVMHVNCV